MLLSGDQRFFLSILREAGCVRANQVLPLLRLYEPRKEQYQADAMLRTLRYGGQAITGDGLVRLPDSHPSRRDEGVLLALDALIALAPKALLQISGGEGLYPLRFALERADGWVDSFAFVPVPLGQEARVAALVQAEKGEYVFLLHLEDLGQHTALRLARSHYFVVGQGASVRFYKGGGAGR